MPEFIEKIDNGGWAQWSKYVLLELQRLNTALEKLTALYSETLLKLNSIEAKIANISTMEDELKELRSKFEYMVTPFLTSIADKEKERRRAVTDILIKAGIPTIGFLIAFILWLYFTHTGGGFSKPSISNLVSPQHTEKSIGAR